jgi:hypothetical protein
MKANYHPIIRQSDPGRVLHAFLDAGFASEVTTLSVSSSQENGIGDQVALVDRVLDSTSYSTQELILSPDSRRNPFAIDYLAAQADISPEVRSGGYALAVKDIFAYVNRLPKKAIRKTLLRKLREILGGGF